MKQPNDPLDIASELIRCPSVTPDEGGAQSYLISLLESKGFTCHKLNFSEEGTPDVENLYARIGDSGPHLSFAGHTDVVPVGDEAAWTSAPFEPTIRDGILYGRGASDMKGGVACFIAAALDYVAKQGDNFSGSISFIITGDEEGPAINGTRKMLDWITAKGEAIDHCLVGEPTNPAQLGDAIKIGRRGSLSAALKISGVQGHVAYPEKAANPVTGLVAILGELTGRTLDEGTAHFSASNLEVTSVDVGNPADNVIPAHAEARFNIRFNDTHDGASLKKWIEDVTRNKLEGTQLKSEITYQPTSDSFVTEPGPLVEVLSNAVQKVTGRTPELSTSGGTSDARFIKNICPVVEFGLINESIHQVDENAAVDDIYKLRDIYRGFIEGYFDKFSS